MLAFLRELRLLCRVGQSPPGEEGVRRQVYKLRKGEGFLEGVSLVLSLEGWAEPSAVEVVELAGEGVLGRGTAWAKLCRNAGLAGNCKLVQVVGMQGE